MPSCARRRFQCNPPLKLPATTSTGSPPPALAVFWPLSFLDCCLVCGRVAWHASSGGLWYACALLSSPSASCSASASSPVILVSTPFLPSPSLAPDGYFHSLGPSLVGWASLSLAAIHLRTPCLVASSASLPSN